MVRCTKCFTPETRPRVTFNKEGVCNACQWAEEKKTIDWERRQKYFGILCDYYSGNGREPDCIVPWSGGKDSIYVAYKMKEFGMTPLLVTVIPHLETEIGKWNRQNMCKEFGILDIKLDEDKYRTLAKKYFVEQGRPKHPWETAISATIINRSLSIKNKPFIIYGEEGEQEYGGISREKDKWANPVDKEYLMKYYWQDNLDWEIPTDKQFDNIFFTQWSRFENWSPSKHAEFAINKGMKIRERRSLGTYTTCNQLSDKLQDLHTYLMYLKFGFGRCTSDCNIAIREGNMERSTADLFIGLYDGEYPQMYEKEYCEYFNMTRPEFLKVLNSFYRGDR